MNKRSGSDFDKIAEAIGYIERHFTEQPSLKEIAKSVRMSPSHFQRMFTAWAGTSPKKFLEYISLEYAKKLLKEDRSSVLKASLKTGLSSSSRLHDLFVNIEGMTPGEYKNGGKNLAINYSFAESPFGRILIASTSKGICCLMFAEHETGAVESLYGMFPQATFTEKQDLIQKNALRIFQQDRSSLSEIKLHLKGTDFQLKVWEALLKVPFGQLSTYGDIAARIKQPKACRAVGTAVGNNPVAFLIPCHRVIQSTGALGSYHWGSGRKVAMIGWEGVRCEGC
jgi:AraC family transcriptional regulator of adaptative response/methylated-DNA-[protein]-cysteine methyltransferase